MPTPSIFAVPAYLLMKRLISLLAAISLFAGCENSENSDFIQVLPSDEIFLDSDASEATLTVASSGKWSLTEATTWVTVTPEEGKSEEEITISVAENSSEDDRTGAFTLTCGTASVTVSITQYGAIQTNYTDLKLDKDGTSMTYGQDTGTIRITYDGNTPPTVDNGRAVVLTAQQGFDIRVVESSSVSGNTLTLETSPGNMEDLFMNTGFTLVTSDTQATRSTEGRRVVKPSEVGYFDTEGTYHKTYDRSDMTKGDYYHNGDELWSFHKDFNGKTIAQGSAGRLYWEKCAFDAGLHGEFTFDFGEKKISEIRKKGDIRMFRCLLKGNIDMDLLLHYIYEDGYSEEDDGIIAENVIPTMVFKFMVGTVPVYIQVDTHLGKSTEFSAEGQIEASAGVKLGTEVSMGVEWSKDAGARAIKDVDPYMTLHHPEFKAEASAEAKVSYYPHIDIRLYRFFGPWAEPRPYIRQTVEAGLRASTDGENHIGWKADTYAGQDLKMGLDLDFGILEFNAWESEMINIVKDQLLFEAPYRITTISPEDGTRVKAGETVTAEFLVESYSPLTGEYYPCPLALVNLEVTAGELDADIAVSDLEGLIQADWTAPASAGSKTRANGGTTQTMTAEVTDAEGEVIDDATLTVEMENERPTPRQWVDLGLPSGVKWAGWNVGASRPEEYGGYYAWGETEEKSEYTLGSYVHKEPASYHADGSVSEWQYKDIGECISGTSYDVATVKWGGGARMPTVEEIEELAENCYHEEGYLNDIAGVFAIGPNENSIFFPYAGFRNVFDDGAAAVGDQCRYWSGSIESLNTSGKYGINLYSDWWRLMVSIRPREDGLPVRPVSD